MVQPSWRRWSIAGWSGALAALGLLGIAVTSLFAVAGCANFRGPPPPTPPGLSRARGPVTGERYQWRPVAIGGGGFITGIDIDSSGRTMVARSDVYGAYLWNAKLDRWVQLVSAATMPEASQYTLAGGVYEVTVAPGRPDRIYLAMQGRMFRSDDRGRHFVDASVGVAPFAWNANSEFRFAGPYIAVDPKQPDTVLLGTPEAGLWRSDDAGKSWAAIASVPYPRDLRPDQPGIQAPGVAIWYVPGGGGRIYAASAGNGMFESDAAGRDFHAVGAGSGPRTIDRGAFDASGAFYAIDSEAKKVWVLRSGEWSDLSGRGLAPARFAGVTVDPRGGRILVSDQGGEIWCSQNRGEGWSHLDRSQAAGRSDPPWLGLNNHSYFAAAQMLFDPAVAGRLWVAAGEGPYVATLGGQNCPGWVNWRSQARGIEELVAEDAIQSPGHAPLFAAIDFGIHLKPDLNRFSTTYGPKPRPLIAAQKLDWSPADPAFIVTNASDTRRNCCSEDGDAILAGYSTDGGQSWQKFASLPTPPGTEASDPWRIAYGTIAVAANSVDNIVWAPAFDRSPFYTLDRGVTWQRVVLPGETLPLTGSFANEWLPRRTLAADRVLPGTFYLVHSGTSQNPGLAGLWRTRDGGRSWSRLFAGEIAPNSAGPAKLRSVPGKAGHLFFTSAVGGGADTRLRRSTDGGAHWTAINGIDHVDDVGFGKRASGSSYPTIFLSGQIRGSYGIWRSVDGGSRWQRLAGFPIGRLDQVNVIEGDKDVFGRVYVGYVGSGWLYGQPAPCRPIPVTLDSQAECARTAAAVTAGTISR